MLFTVITGFLFIICIPLLAKAAKNKFGLLMSGFPLLIFIYFATFYSQITKGGVINQSYQWVTGLGINLDFYLDGLSLIFVLIITSVGFAVFLYASGYMKNHKFIVRFYVYISIFMVSMLGIVLSDNLFSLFIFWELTSISSFMLIGFNHHLEKSRYSALQALLVTGGGGLAMLAGFIILGNIADTYVISELVSKVDLISNHPDYTISVILILLGAFTKSAQFPFHFWLPNAMSAPTPVSAYLHSATMVKAGIYLMARLNPAIGGTELWQYILLISGSATMLFAALLAFKQTDLKKLLAYSTLSVLGTLTMLLGIGNELAIKAFIIYLIAHSLYKGALFMVAGNLDFATGTRDINILAGLKKYLPITAGIAIIASLSKMGIVPLIGFVGKETVYAAALEYTDFGILFILLAVISNIFIVYITITVGFRPFLGAYAQTPKSPVEVSKNMLIGPALLSLAGIILGVFASFIINKLINYSELGIIADKLNIPVKLWHGFNLELALSVLTVGIGILVYKFRSKILGLVENVSLSRIIKPSAYYDTLLNGSINFAKWQTKFLQNGYLRIYLSVILIFTFGLLGYTISNLDFASVEKPDFNPDVTEIIIGIMVISSTYFAVRAKKRLSAIIAIGVVGYSIALIFMIYSAPDLAMTQFAIETLTVILFMLVIYKLSKYLPFSNNSRRIRDIIIAGAGGLMMSVVAIYILSVDMQSELKQYFAETSLPIGKGKNIVNVILVDFRALDTLGEIVVLAIAAIGVFTLMKLRKQDKI